MSVENGSADGDKDTTRSTERRRRGRLKAKGGQLEALIKEYVDLVHRDIFGANFTRSKGFSLDLKLRLEPTIEGFTLATPVPLLDQVRQALREMEQAAGGYRPGRVYCYRCESPDCAHAKPPRMSAVFSGYGVNGVPGWADLSQVLLDAGDTRVDLLFGRDRALVTRYMNGRELKAKLLHEFGKSSKTYDVLCQLVIGYLRVGDPVQETMETAALTIQAVESRGLGGRVRLDANLISMVDDELLMDGLLAAGNREIYDIYIEVKRRFKDIERQIEALGPRLKSSQKSSFMRQLPRILQDAARAINHLGQQRTRRTTHARERVRDNRPVPAAADDVLAAGTEQMLIDDREATMVVRGPRNRIHVFSLEGIHVTSLKLGTEAVDNRIRRKRWRPAREEETMVFLEKFRGLFAADR